MYFKRVFSLSKRICDTLHKKKKKQLFREQGILKGLQPFSSKCKYSGVFERKGIRNRFLLNKLRIKGCKWFVLLNFAISQHCNCLVTVKLQNIMVFILRFRYVCSLYCLLPLYSFKIVVWESFLSNCVSVVFVLFYYLLFLSNCVAFMNCTLEEHKILQINKLTFFLQVTTKVFMYSFWRKFLRSNFTFKLNE